MTEALDLGALLLGHGIVVSVQGHCRLPGLAINARPKTRFRCPRCSDADRFRNPSSKGAFFSWWMRRTLMRDSRNGDGRISRETTAIVAAGLALLVLLLLWAPWNSSHVASNPGPSGTPGSTIVDKT